MFMPYMEQTVTGQQLLGKYLSLLTGESRVWFCETMNHYRKIVI